jgi:hypothetical protein
MSPEDRFKLSEQKRREKARIGSEQIHNDLYHSYKKENRWTLFGKYYGTEIDKLPQSYLTWIIENRQDKYKELAEKEFYRRKNT